MSPAPPGSNPMVGPSIEPVKATPIRIGNLVAIRRRSGGWDASSTGLHAGGDAVSSAGRGGEPRAGEPPSRIRGERQEIKRGDPRTAHREREPVPGGPQDGGRRVQARSAPSLGAAVSMKCSSSSGRRSLPPGPSPALRSHGGSQRPLERRTITPSWAGELMAAATSRRWPQAGQSSGSESHTRWMRRAQLRRRSVPGAPSLSSSVPRSWRPGTPGRCPSLEGPAPGGGRGEGRSWPSAPTR